MSVALLVLLPILLSGYYFSTSCRVKYYRVMRLEGYHLYFQSALTGSFFVGVSALLYVLIYTFAPSWLVNCAYQLKLSFNMAFNVSEGSLFDVVIVALLSIVLSKIIAAIINYLVPDEFSYIEAIRNDDFELLLYRAITHEKLIAVSMENRKEYVGWVVRGFEPEETRRFLRILPLQSGFRDKDTGKVKFTTKYKAVMDDFFEGPAIGHAISPEDFEVILPIADIKSAHIFDIEAYNKFQVRPPLTYEVGSVGNPITFNSNI